jgi:hypothetical protein
LGHRARLKTGCAGAATALAQSPDRRTYWRLTPTLHVCAAHGRVIFLYVARDRNFGLPEACEPAFIDWLSTRGSPLPDMCRECLVALGIIHAAEGADLRPVACTIDMPLALDAERPEARRPSATDGIALARILLSTWQEVRRHRLQAVLGRSFARSAGARARDDDVRTRLAIFRAVRPWIPVPRVCLHDCLALVRWLGPDAAGVELVLGVSPYPFSAHCWVQMGGRVIDDHPQSPSRYQPILRLP